MSSISSVIERHRELRNNGINLIASENRMSSAVSRALSGDLAGRYHSEWYGGSRYAMEVIRETEKMAEKVFDVKHAIVTSLSGNMCDLAVMFAFSKPGDPVAMVHFESGGYPLGLAKFQRRLLPIPADPSSYSINVDEAIGVLLSGRPPLTILGASYIPFPHPVKAISGALSDVGVCVYDASHVLGLIACGSFQDPIREGAEILVGSTHKSLYGPQGGIVLTNSDDHAHRLRKMLDFDLEEGIGLVDNPHMSRIAALGLALEEISRDTDYGSRVIDNAKALASALDDLGVPLRFGERGYTESHQIFLDMDFGEAQVLCRKLESAGIFIDVACRLGVAEATHRGMSHSDMGFIAQAIADVFHNRASDELKAKIRTFAANFRI